MRRLIAICLVLFLIAYAVPSFAMGGGGKNRHRSAASAQQVSNTGGGSVETAIVNDGQNNNDGPGNVNHRVPEPEISALIGSLILGGLLFNGVRRIRSKR
ncbi:MAG: hypothetical protein ACOYW7_13145 [Nitrospirota bacterium]